MTAGSTGPVSRDDLAITLAVRKELGPDNEPAVIGEFLERLGPAIDARVDERLQRTSTRPAPPVLALASVVAGIPITAIALGASDGAASGIVTTAVAWAGLAAVNLAAGRRRA